MFVGHTGLRSISSKVVQPLSECDNDRNGSGRFNATKGNGGGLDIRVFRRWDGPMYERPYT
jgi:hypothetical protein